MVQTVYQYDNNGYFTGEDTAYNGLMPHGCTAIKPARRKGYIPQWDGEKWKNVQNHMGETGYIDGVYTEITEYGPLPKGFSTELPVDPDNERKIELAALEAFLAETDYIALKIAESHLSRDEFLMLEENQKYIETLKQREEARHRIAALKAA